MKEALRSDFKAIADVLDGASGIFAKEAARSALGRIKEHIAFDRTQREFLAADLVALADGKPVKLALAEAVAYRFKLQLQAKDDRIAELEELIRKGEHKRDVDALLESQSFDARHVCGLTGYNPMIDPPCRGCEARQ